MKTQVAVDEFIDSRVAANLSKITIAWYRAKLDSFARFSAKLPLKPEPIEKFLTGIEGQPDTKHAYYRALKALYRFVCKRHRLRNPIELVDPPICPRKVMPTLEPDEEMGLIESAELASDLRAQTILTLFVDTGIRTGELAGLRKQDIKTDTVKVSGKTGEREVPISDETRRLLLALIARDNSEDEYVFHSRQGGSGKRSRQGVLSRWGVYRVIDRYMSKVGLEGPKRGGHRLRHAFGKGYLVNGGDIRSLQQIMGHANITTTQKYASLNLRDVITKHQKFSPLRAAHATAQKSFLDTTQILEEAEKIMKASKEKGKNG